MDSGQSKRAQRVRDVVERMRSAPVTVAKPITEAPEFDEYMARLKMLAAWTQEARDAGNMSLFRSRRKRLIHATEEFVTYLEHAFRNRLH